MRRGSMVVMALLAATTALMALPGRGNAQPSLPGILGEIISPLGRILGAPRFGRRSPQNRSAARPRGSELSGGSQIARSTVCTKGSCSQVMAADSR